MSDSPVLLALLVAVLGGAAIGVERQKSGHATGSRARFAGVRTFPLLGGVSGLAGWLAASGQTALSVVVLAGPVALTVVAYARASREDIDATTEVAALIAIASGVIAGLGFVAPASGITAITVLLLVEKSRLHALVARIDDEELRAAARFGVMAVVVLPLLPSGPYGPLGGVRPHELWLLVLFFTGLSFAGYFARRIVGAAHGYPLTGALAGLVSSTSATLTFARLSRARSAPARTLATGAIAACTVLFPRVLVATLVLDRRVAVALLPVLVPPFALGAVAVGTWLRGKSATTHGDTPPSNPLQIWPALQMAATFQVVLFVVALVNRMLGEGGLLVTGGVLGLTDVDAFTISMARSATQGVSPETAAQAIAIGITANCVMKAGIAALVGTPEFARRTGGVLGFMAAALAATALAINRW